MGIFQKILGFSLFAFSTLIACTKSFQVEEASLTKLSPGLNLPTTAGAAPVDDSGKIIMPLEVMSASTDTREAKVVVPAGATAARLRMKVNNLSYDNKASIQINNGSWISLTNANVTVEGSGKAYGGIGGGQNTIVLSVAITGAVNGDNIIRFRFNGTDGVSSGYRVLDFNLRNSAGQDLIAASAFSQEDPKTWKPPMTSTADTAEGERLWRNADLLDGPEAGAHYLRARCTDCHAQDGRDLYHFNYSNNAIIVRSMHHGLTETQGKQIASYIRSLGKSLPIPGGKCRPWNPPYQPGPGLDSAPLSDWSCGAGLEAVLENDGDSLTYIPGGLNKASIATGGRLNIREIPIAFQLPDWKHWLPRIHPKDAYGDYFVNSNLNKMYNDEGTGNYNQGSLRKNLAAYGADYVLGKKGSFDTNLYYWGVEWGERFQPPSGKDPNVIADQQKMYGVAQWLVMKNWELAQEFNLETLCPQNWAQKGGPANKVEPRSWCGLWRFVFDASPHILKFPNEKNMFGSVNHNLYIANQWYYLAILVNPGSGAHNEHLPTDWQYAYGLVDDLARESARPEPARKFLYIVKGTQEADNGVGVGNPNKGWTFRLADPTAVWNGGAAGMWKNVSSAQKNAAMNAFLETWLDRSESFPAASWARIDGPGGSGWCGWSEYRLCWADYVPNTLRGTDPTVENFATWSFKFIPQMRADGVDGALLNRYAKLMNTLYPNGGFAALVK